VDLPGYGYARVSLEERASWKELIESYLVGRDRLALSFLLIDARRGWMDKDRELKAWLEFHNRRYQVVATKVDKLKSKNQFKSALDAIQKELPDQQAVPFSAKDGRGVREIWQVISKIKNK
jgi:GTP-binding protein